MKIRGRLQFMKSDRYFWTYTLLAFGILGFSLKLLMYVSGAGIIGSIAIILTQPEKYSKLFSSGFSLMHYTGYLGLIYFALLKPTKSLRYTGSAVLAIIYLTTLFLLFIKVQVVIGMYILFWTYVFSSNNPKGVILKGGVIIVTLGLSITIYDNLKVSSDISTAYEFLIRYLAGSIIGLSEFIASERQMENFTFEGYFFGRYNPVLPFFGIEPINFPEKVFYKIGDNAGTTNTGTVIQSLMSDLGNIGWIIGLFLFPLILFNVYLIASRSLFLTEILFPFLIVSQVGFSIIHMGNTFWKLELVFISILHICIVSITKFLARSATRNYTNASLYSQNRRRNQICVD